jgi:hypothetical protein
MYSCSSFSISVVPLPITDTHHIAEKEKTEILIKNTFSAIVTTYHHGVIRINPGPHFLGYPWTP